MTAGSPGPFGPFGSFGSVAGTGPAPVAPPDPPAAWDQAFPPLRRDRPAPRGIATDLDGTLLRGDQSVSSRSSNALRAAVQDGMQVVLVTARPPRWVNHLAPMVASDGIVICANGAFVYDVRRRRVVEQHTMPADLVLDLVTDLRRHLPGIVFGFERVDGLALEPRYSSDYPLPRQAPRGRAEDLLDLSPGKMLARCPDHPDEDFQAVVTEVVGARAVVSYSGAVGLAEIGAPGVTKAAALSRWIVGHGMAPAEVWAFGDMPNDLPMIEWAGVGVAVANAHPALLTRADLICPSNDEDGVAQVVEALVDWSG